ncbi:MAG: hypothetical protein ACI9B8_002815, partial [Sulfitobacter sp.]
HNLANVGVDRSISLTRSGSFQSSQSVIKV